MDQKTQLKILMAEKKAERHRAEELTQHALAAGHAANAAAIFQEEEILRLQMEHLENEETPDRMRPATPNSAGRSVLTADSSDSDDSLSDSDSDDDDQALMEEFSDRESLVSHTDFGSGPIRHRSRDGKFYHGLNNHSSPSEIPANTNPNGNYYRLNYTGKFLHCFYIRPSYQTKPPTRQWDHHCAPTFCTHHENPMDLNKNRSKVAVFRCLGH